MSVDQYTEMSEPDGNVRRAEFAGMADQHCSPDMVDKEGVGIGTAVAG